MSSYLYFLTLSLLGLTLNLAYSPNSFKDTYECSDDVARKSCKKIENKTNYSTYKIVGGDSNRCTLYEYVNLKGKLKLTIVKSSPDVVITAWWNKGIFYSNTKKRRLSKGIEVIELPKWRGRLRIHANKGSATIKVESGVGIDKSYSITTSF